MKRTRTGRKILAVLMSLVLTASVILMPVVGYAADNGGGTDTVVPMRWDSILLYSFNFKFNGTTGSIHADAEKQPSATFIEMFIDLYYLNDAGEWELIETWYDSSSQHAIVIDETFTGTSGVTYKAVLDLAAYTGTIYEEESPEIIRVCP